MGQNPKRRRDETDGHGRISSGHANLFRRYFSQVFLGERDFKT